MLPVSSFEGAMHRIVRIAGLAAGVVAIVGCGKEAPVSAAFAHTRVVETGPMRIDRLYHSMDGPHERLNVDPGGLDWITAYTTRVIDAESRKPMGDEFFCHSQIPLLNANSLLLTA